MIRRCAMLPSTAWTASVRTAQGRTVAASEVPWKRTREVSVHAVDLVVTVLIDCAPQQGAGRLEPA